MRRMALLATALLLASCGSTPEERANFAAKLNTLGASMRDAPAAQSVSGNRSGMTCLKTGEVTSGFNKMCTYNCGGSAAATTVAATSLCPLTTS